MYMHKACLSSHIVPQPMLIKPKNKNRTCSQKIKVSRSLLRALIILLYYGGDSSRLLRLVGLFVGLFVA